MAKLLTTASAASVGTPPTGTRIVQYTASISGATMSGVLMDMTSGTRKGPGVVYFHGGYAPNPSFSDAHILSLAEQCAWDDYGAPEMGPGGYVMICPLVPGGAAGTWTGGAASAGVDQFGGAEVEVYVQSTPLVREGEATTAHPLTPKTTGGDLVYYGASAGCIRACVAIKDWGMKPDVLVMRSPYINIYDWDSIATATQDAISALMSPSVSGGWTSASETTFANLRDEEKVALWNRSPVQWPMEVWPDDMPIYIGWGENDTTVPEAWVKPWAAELKEAGKDVRLSVIPTGDHAWTQAGAQDMLNLDIRGYLTSKFRFSYL